jgi:hypothetical protein
MRNVFLGISSSIRKVFVDIFSARANTTGSLGTASDGSQWEAVSKVIEVQAGKAVANYVPQPTDAGSEYPIAVVNMPTQNNIITLEDTDIGSGVALWVQTSADWWMVSVDSSYNTIPGATNYTAAPPSFTGQSSYNATSAYTSADESYTSVSVFSAGPTVYSGLPIEYSSSADVFTSGPTNYTSSLDNFSSTPNFTSSTPFTSGQTFTSSQAFSAFTPYSVGTNYGWTSSSTANPPNYASNSSWNRWSPYTSTGFWNSGPGNVWNSALGASFSARYSKSGSLTNCCWTRGFVRSATTFTRDTNWTRSDTFSRQDFWNLATNFVSSTVNPSISYSYTATGNYPIAGTTTWTSSPQTYTAGTPTYTAGLNVYTAAQFYTSSAGAFSSTTVFSSSTPYSSATPYTSGVSYTASTTYFANVLYTSATSFTSGSTFTSAVAYSSTKDPDTFAYSAILKISKSVSNVVSDVSSLIVSTAQTIKSILVQTSENQITAKAFSGVTPITQLGTDLIYNATGVIINTKYGISISKAEYNNDKIAGSIKIERGT